MTPTHWTVALCALCTLAACSSDERKRTQIVVVVDSDLAVPSELDEVHVRAARDGAMASKPARGMLGDGGVPLPVSVTLEPVGSNPDPIEVTASGYLNGKLVVEQIRSLSFAPGKSVVLKMTLSRACAAATAPKCEDDQTCVGESCEGRFVDVGTLHVYTGPGDLSRRLDAGGAHDGGSTDGAAADAGGGGGGGSGDAGADASVDSGADAGPDGGVECVPTAETCNGADDDCDLRTDEDFDLDSLARCGDCDTACPESPPFAASVCVSGTCRLVCAPGTADCDDMVGTGCEARLSEPATCGDCDTKCGSSEPFCAQEGTTAACVGACGGTTPTECTDSCVDTETDIFHCNMCNRTCPGADNGTPTCTAGACGFACPGSFQDCDAMAATGCETNTSSDVDNCGGCAAGNVCLARASSTRSCIDGDCGFVCNTNRGNCDGMAGNGCETNTLGNKNHCGGCNNPCSSCCAGTRCGTLGLLGACL